MIKRFFTSLKVARIAAAISVFFWFFGGFLAYLGLNNNFAESTRVQCDDSVYVITLDSTGEYKLQAYGISEVLPKEIQKSAVAASCTEASAKDTYQRLTGPNYVNLRQSLDYSLPVFALISIFVVIYWVILEYKYRKTKKNKKVKTYFKASKN